jgi:hypothetical protein
MSVHLGLKEGSGGLGIPGLKSNTVADYGFNAHLRSRAFPTFQHHYNSSTVAIMEEVILTPRLELFLQQTADTGSNDLRDYHILRSDAGAMLWR